MVKLNSLVKLLSICALLGVASGTKKECEQLDISFDNNENLSVGFCRENDDGQIISLELKGVTMNQDDVDEIAKYTALRDLDLVRLDLPENLNFKSLHLDVLFIDNLKLGRKTNKFSNKYIPNGILKTLKNVKKVYISSNKISQNTIDELGSLSKIESLYLLNSGFDENIDYSPLKNAKKLTQLTLDTYGSENPVGGLPESLCKVKSLTSLSVSANSVTTIPKCISNLKKLEYLDLSYNEITSVPNEIGKLTNLVELKLNDNNISSCPSALNKLKNLEKLSLKYNQIKKVSISGLSSLEELTLNNNELTSVSLKNLSNLKSLEIYTNKISSFPSSIYKLKNLEVLLISYNKISSISSDIKNLTKLKTLDISNNKITKIPDALGKLKKLERLFLDYNKINGSVPKSLNNLKELNTITLNGNVHIKGRTLTNPKLEICTYTENNEVINGFCLDEKSVCIPTYESLPLC